MPSYEIPPAVKRYIRAMQPASLGPKLRAAKKQADINVLEGFRHRKKVEDKITLILNAHASNLEWRVAYMAYSLALDKSQRTMPWMVDRIREHQILRERWESKGLDSGLLDEIDAVLIWNTTDVV